MKVLIVGSGGREHAIVWKIAQSKKVDKIYCAPGNAGISALAECVDISVMDFDKLVAFAKEKEIDTIKENINLNIEQFEKLKDSINEAAEMILAHAHENDVVLLNDISGASFVVSNPHRICFRILNSRSIFSFKYFASCRRISLHRSPSGVV